MSTRENLFYAYNQGCSELLWHHHNNIANSK